MKKQTFPIVLQRDESLTMEQARLMFSDTTADEVRFEYEAIGPWSITNRVKGLCVHTNFETGVITIYGPRTLTNCRQGGYEVEGWVSVRGKKYSAFTSSHLFELENGHLINVGIIHPVIYPRIK